jgi:hypothetical protein
MGGENPQAGLQLLRDLKTGANPIPKIVYALHIQEREQEAPNSGALAVETTPDGLLRGVLRVLSR